MTSSHGRKIQGRRALAIMAWISLVIVAGLLWYGQEEGIIRIQAWEPAALLLSAYSAFLAIFGWLLFAPQRKSAEESPALFFSGMLTLVPPCFIAYHLMPPSSPLRGWLTIGVFVFGLLSILSPLPAEVFAVPRDRKSYLQPLTDCFLSALNVDEPVLDLQKLAPRSYQTLTSPEVTQSPTAFGSAARDPWADPFYGTGRTMSEVGSARRSTYSESRTRGSDARSEIAPPRESLTREPQRGATYRDGEVRARTQESERERLLPRPLETQRESVQEFQPFPVSPPPVPPPVPPSDSATGFSRPPMTARSAFAPRESRAPNYRPPSTAPVTPEPGIVPAGVKETLQTSVPPSAPRRPLTEPGGRTTQPVGFQTPPMSRPVTSSPPPVPTYLAPSPEPAAQPIIRELPPRAVPDPGSGSALGTIAAVAPLASAATYNEALKSVVSEFRSLSDSVPTTTETARSQQILPVLKAESRVTEPSQTPRSLVEAPETAIRELDRQVRALEADDLKFGDTASVPAMSAGGTSKLNDVKMERVKDEHGVEMIEGIIRVNFEIGQKRAHLHVPFSPPLAGLPEVECESVSDDSVRCKVAVRQPYGIRIEARRSEATTALQTDVGFAAVYSPASGTG